MDTTAFPQAPLSSSFQARPLHQGELGDILVRWPRNRSAPTFSLLETQQQLDDAKREDLAASQSKGPGAARHSIIKPTADTPTFFFIAWANLPRNKEAGRERAYNSGLFYERAETLTKTFLELIAPAPSKEQAEELKKILGALDNAHEMIENKRRLADTSEKMINATTSELLSGKIDNRQAASYLRDALAPDFAALTAQKQVLDKEQAATMETPAAKSKPGP